MSLGMKITGGDGFLALRIQQAKLEERLRETIGTMTASYRSRVVAMLSGMKSGRVYGERKASIYRKTRQKVAVFGGRTTIRKGVRKVQTTARAYRASAPGEPPAVRTGVLQRSIRTKNKGFRARVYAYKPTAFYRHFLEFGAAPPSKGKGRGGYRAPRPLWSPLQAQIDNELGGKVLAAVDDFVNGGR